MGSGGGCHQPHGGCQGVWEEAHPLTKGILRKTTLFIKNEMRDGSSHGVAAAEGAPYASSRADPLVSGQWLVGSW